MIVPMTTTGRAFVPLRSLLRFLGLSPSRFHAWRRLQHACARGSVVLSAHLTSSTHASRDPDNQGHGDRSRVPARPDGHARCPGAAARHGLRASPSTWYNLVRKFSWRRPRLRVHPAKPKVGLRTTRANEVWHIDTTVIRLLDGTRAYLHAVIDNFSRRILAWRVVETFAPVNSGAVLVEAGRAATRQRPRQ
jgi:putative transposase